MVPRNGARGLRRDNAFVTHCRSARSPKDTIGNLVGGLSKDRRIDEEEEEEEEAHSRLLSTR